LTPARLAFAGTPAFAATILDALITGGYPPVIVYTQPDRPAGRGRHLRPSPVKARAQAQAIPVETPRSLKRASAVAPLAAAGSDLLVVAAYGLLLPPSVLFVPRLGCVNVHASLLPRWRGAAPVERAIMAGDRETGVTLMQMDAGLDTGAMLAQHALAIGPTETGAALETRLAAAGAALLVESLPALLAGALVPVAQDERLATYAPKLEPGDARVDWSRAADSIAAQVRALAERLPVTIHIGTDTVQLLCATSLDSATGALPGTIVDADDRGIRIACGSGVLCIEQLRITSRGKGRPMTARDARNGFAALFRPGLRFDA
jgi:methionyl-tRNA formyltransferase